MNWPKIGERLIYLIVTAVLAYLLHGHEDNKSRLDRARNERKTIDERVKAIEDFLP